MHSICGANPSALSGRQTGELELELIQTQMTQKPMLRVEVGARALRNQTGGGGGERVQRPVGALARVCVSGPQNRKRSQEGINPPSELSRSLSRHNHGAAGGGHPIIELPCILYQTPRTLIRERFFTGGVAGFCGSLQLSESLCSVSRRTWPTPVIIQEP